MGKNQPSKLQRNALNRQYSPRLIPRRAFLRSATTLGMSLGVAAFAAGCGSSSSSEAQPDPATATPSPGSSPEPVNTAGRQVIETTALLEIYTWWLGGAELGALQRLYHHYQQAYPGIEIINAGTGDVAGHNTRALMESRIKAGDPPDSFQVHLGRELIDTFAVPGFMEPLDFLYESEGWNDVFPADVLSIASWDGHPWSVPVNIHRSNVLWWNTRLFQEAGIDAPPETIDEFLTAAARLKDAGYAAIAFGESGPGFTANTFENILPAFMTPDQYRGLWTADTDWNSVEVETALVFLKEILENFANEDYLEIDWFLATRRLPQDMAGMMIMGDWQGADYETEGYDNYSWAPVMGTQGIFVLISDSFGLPKDTPHRENALNWLRVIGSRPAQEDFNIVKGSIPARADVDPARFNAYQRSAIADFKVDELVPSVVHGAAANNAWAGAFVMSLNTFANNKDVKQARENLVRAAAEFGV